MDEDVLAALFAPLAELPGVTPAKAALLERAISGAAARAAGGATVRDLLLHLPERYVDRRMRPTIRDAEFDQIVTLEAEVTGKIRAERAEQPYRVTLSDGTGVCELAAFDPAMKANLQRLAVGARVLVSGRMGEFNGRRQIRSPDEVVPAERGSQLPAISPVWPLTKGLFGADVRRAMQAALARLPALPEWHSPALLQREGWVGFTESLRALQAPEDLPQPQHRARLAYDEFLADQLAIGWLRRHARSRPGTPLLGDGRLRAAALARGGFTLTASQAQALAEIDADLAAPRRMLRLLQGDVGSGKTLVAVLAMLRAVEAGAQAALMAPTEVLARQHHRTLTRLSPEPVALLTGSVTGVARRRTLEGLVAGRIRMVVGTHALFQDAVQYRRLALAVIDEQHRFGVDQRLLLGAKGATTDVLVMTATPIPRTLLLTHWGEMEVSRLTEKPAGRQPIRTTLHSLATLPEVTEGIARALDGGAQVYWVCPLVAESERADLAAAEARHEALRARFGAVVGLAHGQQDPAAREAVLTGFTEGRLRLLVATTVIEVGVDVPGATVMVIEHADRFGLAQLHQLRGRVGRGSAPSFCLLLHDDGLSEAARRRLLLLRDTDDGFLIADEDFRLRGAGDVLGTRQSGLPGFRLADPVVHAGLLRMAHQDAALVMERDPTLETPRGRALLLLLRLFQRGEALRTLQAG